MVVEPAKDWPKDPDRAELQARLDRLNEGEDALSRELLSLLVSGREVTISWAFPRLQRDGGRIAIRWNPYGDDRVAFMELMDLVMRVGIDRVRQCRLPKCGRWFVAAKAQQYCSLRHAQDDRNARRARYGDQTHG